MRTKSLGYAVVLCVLYSMLGLASVAVADAPEITITGPNFFFQECGVAYEDPGATAWDSVDGNLTSQIQTSGVYSINTFLLGSTWIVTYRVTNSRGVEATATRTVFIRDTKRPVISLNAWAGRTGMNRLTWSFEDAADPEYEEPEWVQELREANPPWIDMLPKWAISPQGWSDDRAIRWLCQVDYEDPGFTVADNCDGVMDADDTVAVLLRVYNNDEKDILESGYWGDIKNNLPYLRDPTIACDLDDFRGYRLYFIANDTAGNEGFIARDILPWYRISIVLADPTTLTIDCNEPIMNELILLEQNDRAWSSCYGDVSHNLVATGNIDITTPGVYRRTYDVAGHTPLFPLPERDIIVRDTPPEIVLLNEAGQPVTGADAIVEVPWCEFTAFSEETFEEEVQQWVDNWWVRKPYQGYEIASLCYDEDFLTTDTTSVRGISRIVNSLRLMATGDSLYTGSYQITYEVRVDPGGNPAQTQRRQIELVYAEPALTILPPATEVVPNEVYEVEIECGISDGLPEAVFSEELCGLTFEVFPVDFGGLDPNDPQPGEYQVLYRTAEHPLVSVSEAVLNVTVVDTTPPDLVILGYHPALEVDNDGIIDVDCQMLNGATIADLIEYAAYDACEGDLTDEVTLTVQEVVVNKTMGDDTITGQASKEFAGPLLYEVRLTVRDSEDNQATVTSDLFRVVNSVPPVIDVQMPAVVPCGSDPEVFYEYISGEDACGNDITEEVTVYVEGHNDTPPVEYSLSEALNQVGQYTATFSLTDAWGNAAEEKVHNFQVEDTEAPQIILEDPDEDMLDEEGRMLIDCGAEWGTHIEPGYWAFDDCGENTDLTDQVEVNTDDLDTTQPGEYAIVYTVSDAAGNTAEKTRWVVVTSLTPPEILLAQTGDETNGILIVECDRNGEWEEPGVEAIDACVGELDADHIETVIWAYNQSTNVIARPEEPESSFPMDDGLFPYADNYNYLFIYIVSYGDDETYPPLDEEGLPLIYDVAEDGSWVVRNLEAPYLRPVRVENTTPPEIILSGDNPATVNWGDAYEEPDDYMAIDACDGDLTNDVIVSGIPNVDTNTIGTYYITYTVEDTEGNVAEKVREVRVVDPFAPTIALIGPPTMTMECRDPFDDPGAEAEDEIDGDLTDDIVVVVPDGMEYEPGEYTVIYRVTNSRDSSAETTRSVTVEDTTPPVIELRGPASVTLDCGDPIFILDDYAVATDSCDSKPTVTREGDVDVDTPGEYTVTYTATDSAGNSATKELTVIVRDNCPEGEDEVEGEGEVEGEDEGEPEEPEECTGCRACLGCCPDEDGKFLPKNWLGDWLLIGLSMLVLATLGTTRRTR